MSEVKPYVIQFKYDIVEDNVRVKPLILYRLSKVTFVYVLACMYVRACVY